MADFAWMPSYYDGVKGTLSDWLPNLATKVKANENSLLARWQRWSREYGPSLLQVLRDVFFNVMKKWKENEKGKGNL